jgi:hypothetical protein
MSQAKLRKRRQRKLLDEHADCYFCSVNLATTIDHVPPKACFPPGYMPQDFEFPACTACNGGARKQDEIFGFYSILMDFDEAKMKHEEDRAKLRELRQGIFNNYPEALPDETKAYPLNRMGSIITPRPVAVSIPTPRPLKDAIRVISAKLTHALYFRETAKILTRKHQFQASAYQPQRSETQNLTSCFASLLPNLTVGTRSNIKQYGDRFRYISGYKEEGDFFVYAAQFGHGIVLWGIVCGSGITRPSGGPLSSVPWLNGGCGPGLIRGSSGPLHGKADSSQ